MESRPPALSQMVRKWRVCAHFRGTCDRCRRRVHDARCNDRAGASAQRRRSKKDGEDQAIGRSRGGLTTKIHAVVDALGLPVALTLTPGQAADITQAEPLLEAIEPDALIADKGYDSKALVEALEARDITPVIPSKANAKEPRDTDFALYRERNLVERFFGTLKKFRAIATRYDKLATTFLAGVLLVCVILWLN